MAACNPPCKQPGNPSSGYHIRTRGPWFVHPPRFMAGEVNFPSLSFQGYGDIPLPQPSYKSISQTTFWQTLNLAYWARGWSHAIERPKVSHCRVDKSKNTSSGIMRSTCAYDWVLEGSLPPLVFCVSGYTWVGVSCPGSNLATYRTATLVPHITSPRYLSYLGIRNPEICKKHAQHHWITNLSFTSFTIWKIFTTRYTRLWSGTLNKADPKFGVYWCLMISVGLLGSLPLSAIRRYVSFISH